MTIDTPRLGTRQPYSSPIMRERRRRILAEARILLAEKGPDGFTIRELSKRADVSSRTLYHAFGDKEGILTRAVADHIEEIRQEWAPDPLGDDADSIMEEFDRVGVLVRNIPAYTRTVAAIYFSQSPLNPAISFLCVLPGSRMLRWLNHAASRSQLVDYIDRGLFVQRHLDGEFAAYNAWAVNRVSETDLPRVLKVNFLLGALAVTVEPERTRLAQLYKEISQRIVERRFTYTED